MNRLNYKILLMLVIIICSGCKKNDVKNNIVDNISNNNIYIYGKKDYSEYYNERILIHPSIKDNKQLLAMVNYDVKENDLVIDYFRHFSKDDSYRKYKTLLKDDKLELSTVRAVIYDDENNMIYVETETIDEKSYVNIYKLKDKSSKSLFINDYIGDNEHSQNKNIQLVNNDTIAYKGTNHLLLYNTKTEKTNIYDIRNYIEVNDNSKQIIEVDVNENYLDIYIKECIYTRDSINSLRVDTVKDELILNKELKTEHVFLEGDYVFFTENHKNYMLSRKSLTDEREIPCADGMELNAYVFYKDFLYVATDGEGIYKIDLNKKRKELIYRANNKDINGFMPILNILNDHNGFCVGCYYDEELDELKHINYLWFEF